MNPNLVLTRSGRHLRFGAQAWRRTPVARGCSTALFGVAGSPQTFCRARP